MTEPLTDDGLRRLSGDGNRASKDPRVLALLADVVNGYPEAKIHWLTDSREDILHGWLVDRLMQGGRLSALIDKASSVRSLTALASADFQQYANDRRRGDLPTRLFKRLDALLRGSPERFTIMMSSVKPGSTYWTLTDRPATAIFSERDHELLAHVFAVSLVTLDQDSDAKKQTQFISASELERYAFEMLERGARGLKLDQLVLGLVQAYGLETKLEELPDEDLLDDAPYASERSGIPIDDAPDPPNPSIVTAAQALIKALTRRQIDVLMGLQEGTEQHELAVALNCSPATISSEKDKIAAAITECCAARDEQLQLLNATADLLYGASI